MRELSCRIEVAGIILKELSRGSIGRSDLERQMYHSIGLSFSRFNTIMSFLVTDGDIEKISDDWIAPYRITAKGKAFLTWRSTP